MSDNSTSPLGDDNLGVSKSNTREWDGDEAIDAFPEAREEAYKQLAAEQNEVEQEQSSVEEPVEESVEEPVEEEQVEVEAQPEETVPETAEAPGVTPRAQERIQKLANEKRETERKYEEAIAQLAKTQQLMLEMEQRRQQEAVAQQQALEAERKKQLMKFQRDQILRESGFDPTNPQHQFLLSVEDQRLEMEQKLQMMEQELQARKQEEESRKAWETYNKNLDKAFNSVLAGRKLEPDKEEALRSMVTKMAYANNSADPIEEVREVFRVYAPLLKEAAKPVPKAASTEQAQAHRAIAMKGSTGMKKPGDKASGSKPGKLSLDSAREALWGSAKTVWDR